MSRKALQNTNEMCPCPLGILYNTPQIELTQYDRRIGKKVYCSQQKGKEICHSGLLKGPKGPTDAFYGCENLRNALILRFILFKISTFTTVARDTKFKNRHVKGVSFVNKSFQFVIYLTPRKRLTYGGPQLQTQQTVLEAQQNIPGTQQTLLQTQHGIAQTQRKFIETQHGLLKHNTILSEHNTKFAKHNTIFSKHNTIFSKDNTKYSLLRNAGFVTIQSSVQGAYVKSSVLGLLQAIFVWCKWKCTYSKLHLLSGCRYQCQNHNLQQRFLSE